MRTGDTLGAVLVGGASRRFGSDKARAHFRGEPMLRRVLRAMEGATERVVLVGAATGADPAGGSGEALADIVDREGGGRGGEERGGLDVEVLADTVADAGPLAGLHAALREARRCGLGGVLAAGCDLPLLTPALLARIAEVGRGSGRSAAVPVLGPGRLQPLAAWYSLRCLDAAEARLAGEERSLVGLLSRVDAVRIPMPELRGEGEGEVEVTLRLTGANTPEELAALDAEGPGPGRTPLPPSLSVIGYKDSGKTGVAVAAVAELRRRGYRVGALKHGHGFRLDSPGTDSWRLRHEGDAGRVLLTGPDGFALMGDWEEGEEPGVVRLLRRHMAEMEVVVVEGFKRGPLPAVEVFRPGRHPEPFLASGDGRVGRMLALVTDPESLERFGTAAGTSRTEGVAGTELLELDDPRLAAALADLFERELMGRGTRSSWDGARADGIEDEMTGGMP